MKQSVICTAAGCKNAVRLVGTGCWSAPTDSPTNATNFTAVFAEKWCSSVIWRKRRRRDCRDRFYNDRPRRFLHAVVRIGIETHTSRASQASRNHSAVVASIVPLKTIGWNTVIVRVFRKAVDGDLIYLRTWFFRQAPNLDASMFVALTVRRTKHVTTSSASAAAGRVSESLKLPRGGVIDIVCLVEKWDRASQQKKVKRKHLFENCYFCCTSDA